MTLKSGRKVVMSGNLYSYPEGRSSRFLRNLLIHLPDNMVSQGIIIMPTINILGEMAKVESSSETPVPTYQISMRYMLVDRN
jgi:hypothetical protein